MRKPAEITKESASNIAKWRIKEMLEKGEFGVMQKIAMSASVQDGGGVDQVADILWDLGFRITVDMNSQQHQQWLKDGAVELCE